MTNETGRNNDVNFRAARYNKRAGEVLSAPRRLYPIHHPVSEESVMASSHITLPSSSVQAFNEIPPPNCLREHERFRVLPRDSRYGVTDFGRVFSRRKMRCRDIVLDTWQELRPAIANGWYPSVGIGGKTPHVHALVAEAFLGPRPIGHEVNHKNGIRTDASLSNLEYVTPSRNMSHAYEVGLQSRLRKRKLTPETVREIRKLIGTMTLTDIGAKFGVSRNQISLIRDRKAWACVE
jgi:hypothetical protein